MKRQLLRFTREAGLLKTADRLLMRQRQFAVHRRNRHFVRSNPDFTYPPADLAFDAFGHVDIGHYLQSGINHAALFGKIIRDAAPAKELSILEWGCGPSRIIRHMRDALHDHSLTLTGSDWNERSIAWSRGNVSDITFVTNDFLPPFGLADDSFDVIYNFSVLTHLSESVQNLWITELRRVLKPGGLLICTTHGDYYCERLTDKDEAARYQNGEVVAQARYAEGKKWYLTLHPPRYVKEVLLRDFTDVRLVNAELPDDYSRQDFWTARKPVRELAAS